MKQILLVDDEPLMLQMLRSLLLLEGHAVETAWSSKEAWEILNRRHFDLVITDFNMPGMKGDELSGRIKAQWPELPVLMLSGSAEILRSSGRRLPGVDVLVAKPFKMAELRQEIDELLSKEPIRLMAVESNPVVAEPVSR